MPHADHVATHGQRSMHHAAHVATDGQRSMHHADPAAPRAIFSPAGPFPANRFTSFMTSSTSVDLSLAHKELVILGGLSVVLPCCTVLYCAVLHLCVLFVMHGPLHCTALHTTRCQFPELCWPRCGW